MASLPLAFDISDRLRLTPEGRIVDFLDPNVTRSATPEEYVRQGYARKLYYDYGYRKEIMAIAAPINIGSEARQADIVVYRDAHAARQQDQGKARLIAETKAPDVTSGVKQLKSYIFASSAEGGVWINQTDAPKYLHRHNHHLEEWPNIPREGEPWDAIGHHTKRQLRPPHNLVETFKRCHNALYKVGIDSEDLAMDMVRIILAKYKDETNEGEHCEFRVSPSELQSEERRRQVAMRIRRLFEQVRDENRDVFDPDEKITAGDREITTVVSELQDFRFLPEEDSTEIYDVVGAAYEVYVGSHLKGDRGQYFTHRLIVQLLVRLVDPSEKDTILDPAMGSGGFLVSAMRHVEQKIIKSRRLTAAKQSARINLHNHIFGIDKGPKLVKVARTNMILASDGHSGLIRGDSLESFNKLHHEFLKRAGPGIPTVVLTNPPFGATSEHKITEPEILDQFEVGHVWKADIDGELRPTEALSGEGLPPEYLFLERCLQWTAPGGRVGVVLPRGVLDNDKAIALRTLMLRRARLLAVVNCHDDTFKPYTDAKTAILVLERKRRTDVKDENYPIFMAISQSIGHNGVGEPIYKTNAKGDQILEDGEPVIDHDTDEIYAAWQSFQRGQKPNAEYYFRITRRQISANLNLNPVRYLPKYEKSRTEVLALGEREGWTVERIGQIAQVYNDPRFKRPYADKGVTSGPKIVRYFTGNAVTQTRGENIKYLDLQKAKPNQLRMIEKLYLKRGMILITDSGTVGRVVYATAYHDGAVGTNNLIRVVVEEGALRGYLYQFLSSKPGQDQLKANIYGAIVDHIEPDDVRKVFVPIPKDRTILEAIGIPVIRSMELHEEAYIEQELSKMELANVGGFPLEVHPDAVRRSKWNSILEVEFRKHADIWRRETAHTSSISRMVTHPSYLRIIGMGPAVLPLLLAELENDRDHWLIALNSITGEDPAKPNSTFSEAVDAWLSWGQKEGYLK